MAVVSPDLSDRLVTILQELGFDVKSLRGSVGDKTQLNTVEKANMVVAINELVARADSLQDGLANIDLSSVFDDSAVTGENVGWSINKIVEQLTAAKNEILGGAGTGFDTLGKAEAEFNTLSGRVSDLETAMATANDRFDANGKLKAAHLPAFAVNGLENKGLWDMTTALPAPSADNDGHFYITSVAGTYDFGDGAQNYPAGIMVLGDGNSWTPIDRPDTVTVNGKTGSVIELVANDIGYAPAASTGLTASTIKGALDSIATQLKDLIASLGDMTSVHVDVYRAARDA